MHNHHIFLAFCLALWFWPGTSAAAVAQEGASAPSPSLYNEYNNSTVYNGDVYVSDTAPGYNGFAGTWRDPETGDIITSVIAPRQPLPQEQNGPLIVAPQIYPGGGQSPFPPGGGVQPPYPPGPPPRPYPARRRGPTPARRQVSGRTGRARGRRFLPRRAGDRRSTPVRRRGPIPVFSRASRASCRRDSQRRAGDRPCRATALRRTWEAGTP